MKYRNYSIRELWNLYNAILAGGAAGDEYAVLDEIRQREGWQKDVQNSVNDIVSKSQQGLL